MYDVNEYSESIIKKDFNIEVRKFHEYAQAEHKSKTSDLPALVLSNDGKSPVEIGTIVFNALREGELR